MRKGFFIIFMVFHSINGVSNAQSIHSFKYPTPKVTAPNVGALMKLVDYPVNLYTGLVNIEIPLYEVVEGDIRIPISLQYHASGIKVYDLEGQVGAGWSLSSNFNISRQIQGEADDGNYQYFTTFSGDRYSWINLLDGQVDGSPDIYYYKLLDKSGKFYFSKKEIFSPWEGRIVTNPYEPIRIDFSKTNGINSFHIVNDNGMKYDFSERLGDEWYLNKITSANGKYNVTFSYYKDHLYYELVQNVDYIGIGEMLRRHYAEYLFAKQGKDYSYPYVTFFQRGSYSILSHKDPRYIDYDPILDKVSYDVPFPVSPSGPITTSSAIKCPKTIETPYVKIEFVGTTNISSIIITDKQSGRTTKSIYFYYNKNKLTTLEKVEIIGSDGQKEVYTMTYNPVRPLIAYRTHNNSIDHWGYYNGIDNKTLIPFNTLKTREYLLYAWVNPRDYNDEFATEEWQYDPVKIIIKDPPYPRSDRQAVPEAMQHTMLTSITYPTGRKSNFYYEAHQYIHKYSEEKKYNFGYEDHDDYDDNEDPYPDQIKYAGGLRIKKIEEYDPVTQATLIKEYKYGEKEDGVGHIKHQIDLEDYCYEIYSTGASTDMWGVQEQHITKMRIYTNFAVPTLFFGNGSTTVYDYVTEYTVNNKTGERLKSTYHYNIENRSHAYRVGYTKLTFDPLLDWRYGQLLDKIDYKYSNNQYKKVLQRKNEYLLYQYNSTPELKIWRNIYFQAEYTSHHPYEDVDNYELDHPTTIHEIGNIISGRSFPSEEILTEYTDTGDSISSVTKYNYTYSSQWPFYAYGPLLTQKQTMIGSNTWSTEKYSYPFNTSFMQDEENARLKLIENNLIKTVLNKELITGNAHTIQKIKYLISTDNNLPLPATITTNTKANKMIEERVNILRYDTYGNPVHIQIDGISSIFLWSYKGQRLVAEIQAATYEEVNQTLSAIGLSSINAVSESYMLDISRLNGLREAQSLKNAYITTYAYNPLVGIISATDPRGITTYYEYDSFNRLKTLKNNDKDVLKSYIYNYINQ